MNRLNILLTSFHVIHLHLKQFCQGKIFDWYSSYSFADDFVIFFVFVKYLQMNKKSVSPMLFIKTDLKNTNASLRVFLWSILLLMICLWSKLILMFILFHFIWFGSWWYLFEQSGFEKTFGFFYLFHFMKVNNKKNFPCSFLSLELLFRNRAR